MKLLLFIIVFCQFCTNCFGSSNNDYNTTESEQIINSSFSTADTLTSMHEELTEKARMLNPSIVEKIEKKADTEEEKISMLRSWLAHETFEYYKNKFLSDLKQRSTETGRKIEKETYKQASETNYWLNRGIIDTEQCKKDGWPICNYPDGFENYYLSIMDSKEQNNNYQTQHKQIILDKDVPNEDYNLLCKLDITYQTHNDDEPTTDNIFTENAFLDISCHTTKYSEYHEWRNDLVEDVKNGKYDIVYKEKQPEGSPFGEYIYHTRMNENPKAWKSNKIPASFIQSKTYNYSSNATTQKSE